MKTVYFVRHGESEGNVGERYQSADESLTEKGIEQAGIVADRCMHITFDTLIASAMTRAQQTAHIISNATNHAVVSSDLFVERIRPSELVGQLRSDPAFHAKDTAWWESLVGHGPRVGDGENFDDLKDRIAQAFHFLEERTEQDILVVTHGVFLRMMVAYAFYGESLTPELFEPITRTLVTKNTGITVMRHDIESKSKWERPWTLLVWNDHAHLG